MRGLGEVKESATSLMAICMPELWNSHGGVRGVFLRESKYLQYQRIYLQSGINKEFQLHTEALLLSK